MKKLMLIIISGLLGIVSLVSCDDERKINSDKLPGDALDFISRYFGDSDISYAEKDRDNGKVDYKVILSNGTEIDFDENGQWVSVDCKFSTVPDGIIPDAVRTDLATRYPEASVYKIEKELGGYELTVTGDRELLYDYDGVFVREVLDR